MTAPANFVTLAEYVDKQLDRLVFSDDLLMMTVRHYTSLFTPRKEPNFWLVSADLARALEAVQWLRRHKRSAKFLTYRDVLKLFRILQENPVLANKEAWHSCIPEPSASEFLEFTKVADFTPGIIIRRHYRWTDDPAAKFIVHHGIYNIDGPRQEARMLKETLTNDSINIVDATDSRLILSFAELQMDIQAKGLRRLQRGDTCPTCDKPGTKRCTSCQGIVYCSSECQKTDWPAHKHLCKWFIAYTAIASQ